jgi:polysaccharide biosynthesis transport protein
MTAYMPAKDWQPKAGQVPSEAKALGLRELVGIFVRRLPIVCGVPFLAVLVAMAIFISLTPRYTGTVAILIDPKTPGSLGPGTDFGAVMEIDSTKINSIGSIIQSSAVLERVVKSEKLYDDPEFGLVGRSFLARLQSILPGFGDADSSADRKDSIATATARLRKATSVARDGFTYIINVDVTSSDPVKAAHLAQAVGEAYLNDHLQAKYEAARRALSWLFGRLAEMRKETIDSEEAVAEIRRVYGLTATGENGTSTVASQQITELNAAIGAAEVELSLKQVKVEQARGVRQSGGNIEGLAAVMASGVITGLRAQRSDIIRKLAEMQPLPSQQFAARRPEAIRAEEGLRAIEGQISAEEDRIIANLENDYAASRNNVIALKEQLKKLTGAGGVVNPDGQAKLREAQRVANANRQVYDSFLNKFKELEQSQTMQEAEARIIENAHVPTQASFPRLPLFIMVPLGLGLFLGLGGAFVAEYFLSDRMQSTFVTPMQLEQTLHLPMLASVPFLNGDDFEQKGHHLDILQYLVANQFSHFAEALRGIRIGLRRTDGDKTAKVIQITSAVPAEGKSTLAATLALSSALSGARVVLIDCDFRRPMTSKLFHLAKTGGLIDLLAGRAEWDEIANDYSSLTIVPIGNGAQSSLDLIGSARMIEVLKFASEHYDLVFLDSPPVLPVSDAAVLSSIVDKTILLIEWNKTDRDLVFQAIDSVHLSKGSVAGVVLNKVNLATIRSYGYNYSKFFTDTEKYYEVDDGQSSRQGRFLRLRIPFRGAILREQKNE